MEGPIDPHLDCMEGPIDLHLDCMEGPIDPHLDCMEGPIDPHQFGSLQGASMVHALVELVHLWHKALDVPGNMVRVVLLDFAKAFDWVDHATLLKKLASLGLPSFLVRWLTGFLCERRQRVRVGRHLSDWSQVRVGVPQGTLVGPISFLMYINDLQTIVNHVKYVDDSSLWEVCVADGCDSDHRSGSGMVRQELNENQCREDKGNGDFLFQQTRGTTSCDHQQQCY